MELNQLRRTLEKITPLPDEVWPEITALVRARTVAPGEHLLRAGEQARNVFFIRSGLLREYYIDDTGHESTRRFCMENEFSGSLTDLISDGKAMTSIESLAAGEVWVMDWRTIDALAEKRPALMKLLRRFAENLYTLKTRREFEMLTLPAAERYRRFVQEYPALDARLPRNMVASYLGITPVHLSRVAAAGKSAQGPARPEKRK